MARQKYRRVIIDEAERSAALIIFFVREVIMFDLSTLPEKIFNIIKNKRRTRDGVGKSDSNVLFSTKWF